MVGDRGTEPLYQVQYVIDLGLNRGVRLAAGPRIVPLAYAIAPSIEAKAMLGERRGGDRGLFLQQSEQEMFGPDVTMLQALGFLHRSVEHARHFCAERYLD
jgi:hypothetical protein